MRKFAFAAMSASLLFASCSKNDLTPSEAPTDVASTSIASVKRGGEYIVLCKGQSVSSRLLEKINAIGSVDYSLSELGIVMASSSNPEFTAELEKLSEVQKVLPDLKLNWLGNTFNENDVIAFDVDENATEQLENSQSMGLSFANPLVPFQWSLTSVNAKGAFNAGYKGQGAVVAVLDGGFHLNHPDIKDNILSSVSFVPGQGPQMVPATRFSHGSHVAGIIAASDNNIGIAGIAPAAKLRLVKVLGDNGSGAFSWIMRGVVYAADQGVDVINLSLGVGLPRNGKFVDDGGTPNDPSDDVVVNEAKEVQEIVNAFNRVFQYARKKGCLSIAAAGNSAVAVDGQGQGTFYPANCVDVISIASNAPTNWALNQNTSLYDPSSFTNTGSSLIDFAGPGGDFDGSRSLVTFNGFRTAAFVFDQVLSVGSMTATGGASYSWAAGTSMASPAAAGVAALLVGKYGGNISPSQLESKLKSSVVDLGIPGKDDFYGHGQVNAGNAVQQ
jgi:subtilisin family serine protease